MEAPVSGSKGPAANGSLIFLCAGSEPLYKELSDNGSLNAMGKATHFFGDKVGYGTRAKLVVNSLMGTMLAALGEGLALSESVGLDPLAVLNVVDEGAIQTPMYKLKGPRMIAGNHETNFPLKHAHKDMSLACEMAKDANVEYSVINQAEMLFRQARQNHGDEDFSAIFTTILEASRKRM